MNTLFKIFAFTFISILTSTFQVFAEDEEFNFLNYHYYETYYGDPTKPPIKAYLNKEIESIFKLTDSGIAYICQFTENDETTTINMIDSNYEDISVIEDNGNLLIEFINFDTFITVSPIGVISFFDSQVEYEVSPYRVIDSDDFTDFYSSEEPPHNFFEFISMAYSLNENGLLSKEGYDSLLNTMFN